MKRVENRSPVAQSRSLQPTGSLSQLKKLHLLKRGSSGSEVRHLQQLLKAKGLYKGEIDGQFGPLTAAAVKEFQQANGLKVDGIVGQQTWGATMGIKLEPGYKALAPSPRRVVSDGFEKGGRSGIVRGRTGAPAALARYGNGRIPASALTPIGGGHRLFGPAAAAFKRMEAAAAKAGVRLGVTDSYRSYAAQVDVARRKGLYKNGGWAAVPGTSKHGWGLAIDVSPSAYRWLSKHAAEFGFARTAPREPWHYEYRGAM